MGRSRVLQGFDEASMERLLDRQPFVFNHQLLDHPALSLQNLAEVIPQLAADQVFHSNGRLTLADNLDRAHREHSPEQGLQEALQQLRDVDAYIMVRKPETHPSFQPLFRMLEAEVSGLVRSTGQDGDLGDAKLYLFIASPNSVTPFHIDRYSTFLMQVRGSKEVVVYPPWDPRVAATNTPNITSPGSGVRRGDPRRSRWDNGSISSRGRRCTSPLRPATTFAMAAKTFRSRCRSSSTAPAASS